MKYNNNNIFIIKLNKDALRSLVHVIQEVHFSPGDFLFKKNEYH